MSSNFINTIQQAIDESYHLKRDGKRWILEEGNPPTEIRVPSRLSIAFSLDKKDAEPFAFFSNNPPKDFAKVCDAILFCCSEDRIYLFIIEAKTGYKGDYKKQLINGKLFCDWLIALYTQHKSSLDPSPTIIPLLIWKPRLNSVRKGTTTHHESDDSIKKTQLDQFDGPGFEIKNRNSIVIFELVSELRNI